MITRSEILNRISGKNCAMVTFGAFSQLLGHETEEMEVFARCFGGGMRRGNVCGAVTGAYMVIGAYADSTESANKLAEEFDRRFEEKFGSVICKELLQCDVSIPEEKERAVREGKMDNQCPGYIEGAISILNDLL